MWQSRIHKVREFESSISYNKSLLKSISRKKDNFVTRGGLKLEKAIKSLLKSISRKKHNKDIRTSDNLFIKMSHARYSPLDYGQNQDKDRIHNYGKQILHFALKITSYLFIFFIASMSFFIQICFLAVKNSPAERRSKARQYYYDTKAITPYRSTF